MAARLYFVLCLCHFQNMNSVRKEMEKTVIGPGTTTPVGVKIKCKKLTETEEFKCSISDLYQALTEKEVREISYWS